MGTNYNKLVQLGYDANEIDDFSADDAQDFHQENRNRKTKPHYQ